MGFEDFLVRFTSPIASASACELIAHVPQVGVDHEEHLVTSLAERYFRYEDVSHIIEIECYGKNSGETSVSIRFAVCQAESVDEVFLALTNHLIVALRARARVTEEPDEPELDREFDADSLNDFRRACLQGIRTQRRLWTQSTGIQNIKASCGGAMRLFFQAEEAKRGARARRDTSES